MILEKTALRAAHFFRELGIDYISKNRWLAMNDSDRHIMSVFGQALERGSPEERAAYLDGVCSADAEARARIEALLHAHQEAGNFLQGSSAVPRPAATVDEPPVTESPGTRIGPYKLLEQIGEGGMGTVWMAEQQEPVRRLVALKVIKAGMDSAQVIARFEAERQALALMDHPNIAKVLDAGTIGSEPQPTEPRPTGSGEANPLPIGRGSGIGGPGSGRPFFVMELVKGTPITKYCDEHRLTPRQRLELFVPVCQAIQHAHQKGIIHRDVKPSNVMVAPYDGKPVVKVIDFGVAKATGQRLTERTLFTGFGAVVGTLEYMSPEQAELNNQDIDTRSDIYSLGVLLYELLTGSTPLSHERLRNTPFTEMLRLIREEEAPKPSTRLSSSEPLPTIAAARHTEPAKLAKLICGELDWIVMKALDKERTRRYETATGFAADVQRYLDDEPVQACPASWRYRLRKMLRKHRAAVLTPVALLGLLLAGAAISTWQAIRATRAGEDAVTKRDAALRAEERARMEAAVAKAANDFINDDLLGAADPYGEPNRELKVRAVLDRASGRIPSAFQDDPLVEAAIRHTLANAYLGLGEYRKAEEHATRAQELYRRLEGAEDVRQHASTTVLGNAIRRQGRAPEAEKIFRELLALQHRLLGPEDRGTLTTMANLAITVGDQKGRGAEALALGREAFEIHRRVLGAEDPSTLLVMMNYANGLAKESRYAEAEDLHRESLELMRRKLGPEHPATLNAMHNLAKTLIQRSALKEAHRLLEQTLEGRRRTLGAKHPDTLRTVYDLALILEKQGDLQAAANSYASYGFWNDAARTYQDLMRSEPNEHRHWWRFAIVSLARDDHKSYRRTCEDMLKRFGDTSEKSVAAYVAWTCSFQSAALSDPKAALILVEKQDSRGFLAQAAFGALLYRTGRFREAVQEFDGRIDNALTSPFVAIAWCFRAMAYQRIGDHEKAGQWLGKADQLFEENRENALWNHQVLFRVIRQEAAQVTGVPAEPDGPGTRVRPTQVDREK
jgi:serine/threonine protein kinase/tetratricopeptide (TPR) repeat protein